MHLESSTTWIDCAGISTLAWDGDELVDATTHRTIRLDGTVGKTAFFLGFPFDRGLCLRDPGGLWTLAYRNRHTKAVLLRNGKIVRQFNRDYYCADAFDYPATLLRSGDRALVAHCPDSYDTLVIEDAETGRKLGQIKTEHMEFHSHLSVSPNSQFLLSVGWFWHPVCTAWISELRDRAGSSMEICDRTGFTFDSEIGGAAFLGDDAVVVASTAGRINDEVSATGLAPLQLAVWSISENRWLSSIALAEPAGMFMGWKKWAICFYGHPKAIDLASGEIVHSWPEIDSGRQVNVIEIGKPEPPPIALDPQHGRFAVADSKGVTIVSLLTV
jgi:hypothetical protein